MSGVERGLVCSRNLDIIKNRHQNKTEAFEMWIWRKVEKISWTAKVGNSESSE